MSDLRKAAELALEALEEGIDNMWSIRREGSIEALRQALAQEQEPVLWAHREWPTTTYPSLTPIEGWIPLYTAPPKREWFGLTDDEIAAELTKEFGQWWSRHVSVCKAIEAKLKEKNT